MAKMIELHIIQNLPVNNVNRDENGECKTVLIGDSLRQRISSQAWRRAVRNLLRDNSNFQTAKNSRKWADIIEQKLRDNNLDDTKIKSFMKFISEVFVKSDSKESKDNDEKSKKQTILYMSDAEIDELVSFAINNDFESTDKENKKSIKKDKAKIGKIIQNCNVPVDVALYGRMCASDESLNVNSAVHDSHIFSVNEINVEDDYFTAVDDLDSSGSAHLGTHSYTASTMYRYHALNVNQLQKNMGVDIDIKPIIKEWIRAIHQSFPSGKQNTMAAFTRPITMQVVVKDGQPLTMSDAFQTAIDGEKAVDVLVTELNKSINSGWDTIIYNGEISVANDIDTVLNTLEG